MPGRDALHRASRWFTCGSLLLSLVGCGVAQRGELTEAQCTDDGPNGGNDDDGDSLRNCKDPDCWVYAACSAQASAGTNGGDAAAHVVDASSLPSEGNDGGNQVNPDLDATTPQHDAGSVPLQCGVDGGVTCAVDQTCVLGACVDVGSDNTHYVLRVASAFVPDQTTELICFDTVSVTSGVCSVSPAFLCGNCKPDPYVITTINGVVVNKTSIATDTVAPSWVDPGFEVELKPDDVLRFTVMDNDPTLPKDSTIFWCERNQAALMTGSAIQCPPDDEKSKTIPPPPGAKFTITVEFSPAPTIE